MRMGAVISGAAHLGLIALAVQCAWPELDVRLFEGAETLGGNHRWSWFDSDLDDDGRVFDDGVDEEDPGAEDLHPAQEHGVPPKEPSRSPPERAQGRQRLIRGVRGRHDAPRA